MIDPNREPLENAADVLGPPLDELVFGDGCDTGLRTARQGTRSN